MRDLEDDTIARDNSIPSLNRSLSDLTVDELRQSDRKTLQLQQTEVYDHLQRRMAEHRHDIMGEVKRRDAMDDVC